jgi:hypothetical protein
VIAYYETRERLRRVDGCGSADAVAGRLRDALA